VAKSKKQQSSKKSKVPTDASRNASLSVLLGLSILLCIIHLWFCSPFHRPLLDLDDLTYVGPLENMTIETYFSKRLWQPDSLSFPVRDLTYLFDFYLSKTLGVKTFVMTSTLLFCAYVFAAWRLFTRLVSPAFALALTAIVALHPINVEVLQWIISRKHLLAALFALIAVSITINTRARLGTVSGKVFTILLLLYALSLLSHPPAMLLPAWVAYMLWPQCKKSPIKLYGFLLSSFGIALWWLSFQSSHNKDYAVGESATAELISLKITNGVLGLGRAVWQLVAPIQQAIYFDVQQPQNAIGLCILAAILYLLIRYSKKSDIHTGTSLLALGALLFVPQLAFTFGRKDFTMADRFLFMPLPYLLTGAALCLKSPREWSESITSNRSRWIFGLSGLCLVYSVITSNAALLWRNELPLFKHCVRQTGSDRCWWHYSRELFKAGCPMVSEEYDHMKDELKQRASDPFALYPPDGALILSTCEATAYTISNAEKTAEIDALLKLGATPQALTFSRNLLSIQEGDLRGAYTRTIESFLQTTVDRTKFSVAILGVMQGQLRALCEVPSPSGINCFEILQTFQAKYAKNDISPKSITLGYNSTKAVLSER
jgi:hypothetical protein